MPKEKNITLDIEGMDCSSCARTIEKHLVNKGYKDVFVDFALAEATLSITDSTDVKKLERGIESLGYSARLRNGETTERKEGLSVIGKKFWFSFVFTLPLMLHMVAPSDSFLQNPLLQAGLSFPVFVLGVWHFGRSAWGSVKTGTPNMDLLIFIGSTAAFAYSVWGTILYYGTHEVHRFLFYETSAAIVTLILLGNLLEHRSVKKTTTAIRELTEMQPQFAKRIFLSMGEMKTEEIPYGQIALGNLLLVNAGERVPVDGEIYEGVGTVDESMISGESLPVEKVIGNKVIGGTVLVEGNIKMKTETIGEGTVLSKIIGLVKSAQQQKPAIQRLGDRVSAVFVPAVIGVSILTFLVGHFGFELVTQQALMNAVAVLVIACPCAMGLATPTAVMVGIGRAAKSGILIKGANTMEEFAKVQTIVFDKTGTLTTGNFKIRELKIMNNTPEGEVVNALYSLEQYSAHPIAKSILSELKQRAETISLTEIKEEKGIGISGKDAANNTWKAGSYRTVETLTADDNHQVYLLKNNQLVATVNIEDEIKKNSEFVIGQLNIMGIKTVMLSGDSQAKCEAVGKKLGMTTVYSEQLPDEKLRIIEELSKKGRTAMVGDGVNDAPALARATVGISFGNATEVSINSAQIVLLGTTDMDNLLEAHKISKQTLTTIKQNLFWAFFYNVLAIPVAAVGLLSPIIAALSMAFSDVIVIGNSLRLKTKK